MDLCTHCVHLEPHLPTSFYHLESYSRLQSKYDHHFVSFLRQIEAAEPRETKNDEIFPRPSKTFTHLKHHHRQILESHSQLFCMPFDTLHTFQQCRQKSKTRTSDNICICIMNISFDAILQHSNKIEYESAAILRSEVRNVHKKKHLSFPTSNVKFRLLES